jgi:hypothetical protein
VKSCLVTGVAYTATNWQAPLCRISFLLAGSAKLYNLCPQRLLKFKVAVRAEVAIGLKVTVVVQSQPVLRIVPQFVRFAEIPGSVPPGLLPLIASDVFSTECPVLVVPLSDRTGLSRPSSAALVHGKLCRAVGRPARGGDGDRHRSRRESRRHIRRHLRVRNHSERSRLYRAKFHRSGLNQP